jgi:hypothetical protein
VKLPHAIHICMGIYRATDPVNSMLNYQTVSVLFSDIMWRHAAISQKSADLINIVVEA